MPYHFRVHIHLGAHKTASTFIQNWQAKHQPFLKANHIAYIPLEKLRRKFMPAFWEFAGEKQVSQHQVKRLRNILFAEAESCGIELQSTTLFILSEENLLGSLASLHVRGSLYSRPDKRMELLARLFAGCEIQPFLSIRNYTEFYPSAYAETLRHGYIKPFDDYIAALNLEGNSWTGVVESVESVLGTANLWPYETFRGNAHRVLSALLQIPLTADRVDAGPVIRPSLTQKGLAVAMQCRGLLSDSEMKKLVNLLAEKMAFDPPDQKIAIKDAGIISRLHEKYQNDLETLSNRLIKPGDTR